MSLSGTNNFWLWRPVQEPWYNKLKSKIVDWQPANVLEIDQVLLIDKLLRAADNSQKWLLHPCINPLTLHNGQRLQSDFQLSVWIAINTKEYSGSVNVPEPLWAWSPDGGIFIESGKYDLLELGTSLTKGECPCPIALDVWSDSIGFPYPIDFSYSNDWSWAAHRPLTYNQEQQLREEILTYLSAMRYLFTDLPECADWVLAATSVVIPLYRKEPGAKFKSGSRVDLPGLVFFDLRGGEIQILEALIHETAHQHFCIAEASENIINPAHTKKYASPLRPEPRPLRGIFLAYHALVYMCALYSVLVERGLGQECEQELIILENKLDESGKTLWDNRQFLTDFGLEFFERTQSVSEYGKL